MRRSYDMTDVLPLAVDAMYHPETVRSAKQERAAAALLASIEREERDRKRREHWEQEYAHLLDLRRRLILVRAGFDLGFQK